MEPKFKVKDKVIPIKGSYIYVITDYYYDEELGTYFYTTYGLDSSSYTKIFKEDEIKFIGYLQ